jgi:hypothetical protein
MLIGHLALAVSALFTGAASGYQGELFFSAQLVATTRFV